MARARMITRTICTTTIEATVANREKKEVETVSITAALKFKNPDAVVRYAQKKLGVGYAVLEAKIVNEEQNLYGMTEEKFIENSEKIEA